MNTLIFHVVGCDWSLSDFLASRGGVLTADNEVTLSKGLSWLRITRADEVINDYSGKNLDFLEGFGSERKSFIFEWRGDNLLGAFLDSIPVDKKIIVDNDMGLFIFFDLIRDKPISAWVRESFISTIRV